MSDELKIIIFGATGLMGTAFEKVCNKRNIPCIGLSHQDIDITLPESVTLAIEKNKPNTLINCVAIPSIEPCEKEPELALALHCNSVLHIANECAKRDIIMVQPSTHAVFDGLKEEPYTEDDQVKATSVYSATKLLSERLVSAYCPKHYIPRFPTLYGHRRNKSMGFIDKVIAWIREGKELRIADNKMDSPTYSIDAAEAVLSLVAENAPYGVYHIANEGWISYYEFVVKLKDFMQVDNTIHRAKDHDFVSICYKPLRTALKTVKMTPLRSVDEALLEYVNTYLL